MVSGEEDREEGKQTGVHAGETDAGETDGSFKSKRSGHEALVGRQRPFPTPAETIGPY